MPTYVMLTRVSGDALRDPASREELGVSVSPRSFTRTSQK
jgi:hypothetical protein